MSAPILAPSDAEAVIAVLQQALTPAFLLVALGSLLNLIASRLSRIVDRARVLEDRHAKTDGEEHERVVRELRMIEQRMTVVGNSIFLGVLAAIMVCVTIGLLFVQGMLRVPIATAVVAAFILALLLLAGALVQFLREVFLSMRVIHVRDALLEWDDERKGRNWPR